MPSPPTELSPDLAGRLLRFPDLEFLSPGLWRLGPGDLQIELEAAPEGTPAPDHPLWLRLEPATEAPGFPVLDVSLPDGYGFLPPQQEVPSEAAAALVLPGELLATEPVLVYSPAPEGVEGAPELPVPGARVRIASEDFSGLLQGSARLRCQVRDAHGQWTLDVVADPSGSGQPLALCPICDRPADRWYHCAEHGPHCSAHRKVCRSCRRGECAACFHHLSCGTCGSPLCPSCAEPACCCGEHGSCLSHREVCSECHGTHCTACGGGVCAVGETGLCVRCAGVCQACGQTVRNRLLTPCHVCSILVCPTCSDTCHLDGRVMCPTHQGICGECGRSLCPAHRQVCHSCGIPHCRNHLGTCPVCSRPACQACCQAGACRQCRSLAPVDESARERLQLLGEGQPWGRFSRLRGASGPAGWLFSLGVGLQEYRVSTDADLSRVESVHRRPWLGRMLGRG